MSLIQKDRTNTRTINGRDYAWPGRPVVVVCFDGCDPTYIDAARPAGLIPAIDRMMRDGFAATALAQMPTFTNPNNLSIVTGAPPAVHGVSGNFYIEPATGQAVMMVDDAPVRAPSILAGFSQAGVRVAVVTAKDKLRRALGRGVDGIAVSAERAGSATVAEHGIADLAGLVGQPLPDPYSAELSLFVLDIGVALLERRQADMLYLSLSDYVQHAHAPGTPAANAFLQAVDQRLGRLVGLGAVVGIVADHGMTDMAHPDGSPHVLFLGDVLDREFGQGAVRVICPITDPFVRHHGALGGFVRLYGQRDGLAIEDVLAFVRGLPDVALALARNEAAARFDLPADREGDVAVVAQRGVALGGRASEHDLSQLAGARLRSHGGLAEQPVPFIVSAPLAQPFGDTALRNWDIFDAVLNRVEAA